MTPQRAETVSSLMTRAQMVAVVNGTTTTDGTTEYYVNSSVLGGRRITEIDGAGAKKQTNVVLNNGVLAEQTVTSTTSEVYWRHDDPVSASYSKIDRSGNEGTAIDPPSKVEFEPNGGAIPIADPNSDPTLSLPSSARSAKYSADVHRPEYTCVIDGIMQADSGACGRALGNGSAELSLKHEQPRDVLTRLGFLIQWNPVSGRKPPGTTSVSGDPDIEQVNTEADGGKWEMIVFGYVFHDNYLSQDCIDKTTAVNTNPIGTTASLNRVYANFAILSEAFVAGFDIPQAAYALATAEVETTYFTSLRETAPERKNPVDYFNRQYNGMLGNAIGSNDGYDFRGGGYAQLTGRSNYAKFGHDGDPESVTIPQIAAEILITGLTNSFTGQGKLGEFVGGNQKDYKGARIVVNAGRKKADEVARFATKYEKALNDCKKK